MKSSTMTMEKATDAKVAMRTPREPALISWSYDNNHRLQPMEKATLQHELKQLLMLLIIKNFVHMVSFKSGSIAVKKSLRVIAIH